jgi:predicted amidohydrolase
VTVRITLAQQPIVWHDAPANRAHFAGVLAPRRRPELDYDVVLDAANWPAPRRHAWTTLLRARAIENQAFCVGVNRVGTDGGGNAHLGASAVLDFMGQPLLELAGDARVATVPIDVASVRDWRDKFPAHLDADAFSLE